ncbi:hypothetical protein [Nocardia crassostreae]|uniref:hypothetical protein n=1 Tax=Nocardia crassostreae TaxID=53428 RepID=UPI00082F3E6C|nr:hypothetical protein [Nocardia crassostreae]
MTSSNPGPGGPQDPAEHQGTAQWWSTPPAGTDSSAPVADPTMLNYNAGAVPPYTAPPQPLPPQQTYPPMQQPAYTEPPQPAYTGQQPYAQQPQQQFAPAGAGYNYPAPPPPSGGGGKTGWIIGGVLGLVVLVGIGIGAIALTQEDKPSITSGLGGDKEAMDGNYSMDKVTNACSLIDPSVLTKWASTSSGSPEHSETQPTDYSGGSLNCQAGYESQSTTNKYHTNEADITLEVSFNGAYGDPSYKSWKQYDTGTTGTGLSSGDVTGIGEEGYWHAEVRDYSSFTVLDYTVAVRDSNVSVKAEISVDRGEGETVSKEEVAQVAKAQVQKALDGLRKK